MGVSFFQIARQLSAESSVVYMVSNDLLNVAKARNLNVTLVRLPKSAFKF